MSKDIPKAQNEDKKDQDNSIDLDPLAKVIPEHIMQSEELSQQLEVSIKQNSTNGTPSNTQTKGPHTSKDSLCIFNPPEINVKTENTIVHTRNVNDLVSSRRGTTYLTPNVNKSGSGVFSPDGLLPDVSPFTYSIRTVSTSALNDKTFVNKGSVSTDKNFPIDEVPISDNNTSRLPTNHYESIGESTLTASEILHHPKYMTQLSSEHLVLARANGYNPSYQFHSNIQPEIQHAANQLKMDITDISQIKVLEEKKDEGVVTSNTLRSSDGMFNPKYILQNPFSGSNDINWILQHTNPSQHSLSNRSRLSDSNSHPSNLSLEESNTTAAQGVVPDISYRELKVPLVTKEKLPIEEDMAETSKISIPDDNEKYNLTQHISYDSKSSFDSDYLNFHDVYSSSKIISVILVCMIIPPLFFIIGFSSGESRSDYRILRLIIRRELVFELVNGFQLDFDISWFRKLCVWLGLLELVSILVCIGVGFGVGLTRE